MCSRNQNFECELLTLLIEKREKKVNTITIELIYATKHPNRKEAVETLRLIDQRSEKQTNPTI